MAGDGSGPAARVTVVHRGASGLKSGARHRRAQRIAWLGIWRPGKAELLTWNAGLQDSFRRISGSRDNLVADGMAAMQVEFEAAGLEHNRLNGLLAEFAAARARTSGRASAASIRPAGNDRPAQPDQKPMCAVRRSKKMHFPPCLDAL